MLNFNYRFKYHYFGPYSSDLQLEVEEFLDQGILNEKNSDPCVYQIREKYLKNIDMTFLENKKKLIEYLNLLGHQELELVATIHYLSDSGIDDERIIRGKLSILKPNLVHKIGSAFETFHNLQMIEA